MKSNGLADNDDQAWSIMFCGGLCLLWHSSLIQMLLLR
jgi:hypothetical protein